MGAFETLDVGGRAVRLYIAGDLTTGRPRRRRPPRLVGPERRRHRVCRPARRCRVRGRRTGHVRRPGGVHDRGGGATFRRGREPRCQPSGRVDRPRRGRRPRRSASARRRGWGSSASRSARRTPRCIPAERERLVASVVYYGVYTGPHIEQSSAAVQGHFAESDQFESDEGIAELEDSLRSAGREVTIFRYPGTGHWFAEPSRDAYRAEAADWRSGGRSPSFESTWLAPAS